MQNKVSVTVHISVAEFVTIIKPRSAATIRVAIMRLQCVDEFHQAHKEVCHQLPPSQPGRQSSQALEAFWHQIKLEALQYTYKHIANCP